MVTFLSRQLIGEQQMRQRKYFSDEEKKKREFRNKVELKMRNHYCSRMCEQCYNDQSKFQNDSTKNNKLLQRVKFLQRGKLSD